MKKNSKFYNWCEHIWLKCVLAVGFIAWIVIVLSVDSWSKELLVFAAILPVLTLHMMEEGILPGGFGYSHNIAMTKDPKLVDRYTLNLVNDMFVNVSVFVLFLVLVICSIVRGEVLLGFFFPLVLLCFLECVVHTVTGFSVMKRFKSRGKKTPYTPGILTAFFMFLPLFVWAIQIFNETKLTRADWILGIVLCAIELALIFIPEKLPAMTTKIYDKYPYPDHGYFEKYLDKEDN